jgi:hypothetical protein
MTYVDVSPNDVWEEFHRVIVKLRGQGFKNTPDHGNAKV